MSFLYGFVYFRPESRYCVSTWRIEQPKKAPMQFLGSALQTAARKYTRTSSFSLLRYFDHLRAALQHTRLQDSLFTGSLHGTLSSESLFRMILLLRYVGRQGTLSGAVSKSALLASKLSMWFRGPGSAASSPEHCSRQPRPRST